MITLECNYSKKIGLPGYSSHQFSVTLRTEVADTTKVQAQSNHLYNLLQSSVDAAIKQVGYLPESIGNGYVNGNGRSNGHTNGHTNGSADVWKCSDKQKELLLDIIAEHNLPKPTVEALARERFNTPVKMLNKLQASGLISELLEKYPSKKAGARLPVRGGPR